MISEFPLFLFTTLGGLAAGAYVAAAIFPDGDRKPKRPWLFPLACLALLGVGLLGVLGHLGRPERFLLAMSNPSSMIAEEAYWFIAFGVLMLVDFACAAAGAPARARCASGRRGSGRPMASWDGRTSRATATPPGRWQTLPLSVLGDLAMGAALWGLMRGFVSLGRRRGLCHARRAGRGIDRAGGRALRRSRP
ncbi:MAG: DmsC/YnfH family molybdoenzyme membrane anchor subunit [Eggerthella lenta]